MRSFVATRDTSFHYQIKSFWKFILGSKPFMSLSGDIIVEVAYYSTASALQVLETGLPCQWWQTGVKSRNGLADRGQVP